MFIFAIQLIWSLVPFFLAHRTFVNRKHIKVIVRSLKQYLHTCIRYIKTIWCFMWFMYNVESSLTQAKSPRVEILSRELQVKLVSREIHVKDAPIFQASLVSRNSIQEIYFQVRKMKMKKMLIWWYNTKRKILDCKVSLAIIILKIIKLIFFFNFESWLRRHWPIYIKRFHWNERKIFNNKYW